MACTRLTRSRFVFRIAVLGDLQVREIDAGDQDSGLLEANIQGRQVTQTPDKKQGTHQENDGEAHL